MAASTDENNLKQKPVWREYLEAIVIALILALFIRTFIVQAFKIPSGSMLPTLQIGDHILVNKFLYGVKNPLSGNVLVPVKDVKRKDIVVFKYPENPKQDFIKRVIGLPGDKIEIKNKQVFVNGEEFTVENAQFTSPTIIPGVRDNIRGITVPQGSLFVMGDNRDNSHDSRFWGFVNIKAVKGKAFILYWSWDKENFGVRWKRIGDLIH